MGDLTGIFIMGFLVLGTYKTFELFVKRQERIMFIEKLLDYCEKRDVSGSFKMPSISFGNQSSGALKIALLLIGVGIGCLLSVFTSLFCIEHGINLYRDTTTFLYFAYIAIFGGLGLLISYLIESKQSKDKTKEK
jgi:hypothetical protein